MDDDVVNAWTPWQREYRYGAFYLFPPADVAAVVDELRARYDPQSAAICGAHVTLSAPLSAPPSDPQWEELRRALARVPAFDVDFGPLTRLGAHPGVVFALSPHAELNALRQTISATSLFSIRRDSPRAQRAAHMTVAEFITEGESQSLLATLNRRELRGQFRVDRVTYAVPDGSFCFRPEVTIALGTAART
ncbi:MAG: hypothetical protein B7X07_04250 [Actinobacteria bacterium 21-64-8]|nr:MAG: hypothetical protein B7X07_04250 [Actinobacteria bacterium 21-64-8]